MNTNSGLINFTTLSTLSVISLYLTQLIVIKLLFFMILILLLFTTRFKCMHLHINQLYQSNSYYLCLFIINNI